jgi:hypothetical protein
MFVTKGVRRVLLYKLYDTLDWVLSSDSVHTLPEVPYEGDPPELKQLVCVGHKLLAKW